MDLIKLSVKQKRFVIEFIATGNHCEAARRAGYKPGSVKDAPNWLNPKKPQFKPALKAAIDAKLKEIESKKTASAQEVIEYLTAVMRGEVKEEVIVTEGCGDGFSEARIIEKHPSISDRNKAAEQILKRYGKPVRLEEQENQLRIEKLRAEIEALRDEQEADEDNVLIIDDLGGDEDG